MKRRVALAGLILALLAPPVAQAQEPTCVYIEGSSYTFYINLASGAWERIGANRYSSSTVDRLRYDEPAGTFVDRTDIQPSSLQRPDLRGSFILNGPGEVTLRDRRTGLSIEVVDESTTLGFCN